MTMSLRTLFFQTRTDTRIYCFTASGSYLIFIASRRQSACELFMWSLRIVCQVTANTTANQDYSPESTKRSAVNPKIEVQAFATWIASKGKNTGKGDSRCHENSKRVSINFLILRQRWLRIPRASFQSQIVDLRRTLWALHASDSTLSIANKVLGTFSRACKNRQH